jgi:hypothetical protein
MPGHSAVSSTTLAISMIFREAADHRHQERKKYSRAIRGALTYSLRLIACCRYFQNAPEVSIDKIELSIIFDFTRPGVSR